ncbi:alpha/beta fold hydrolase [Acinetobacter sp. ANC 4640]
MPKKILLITGWGVGIAPLMPLQQALQQAGHQVELVDIFDWFDLVQKQQMLARITDVDVVIGWSLGGQLALLLIDAYQQLAGQQKTLINLASNPCFVAQENWSCAMPETEFSQFFQAFQQNPQATLKRFYLNICRGDAQAKQHWLSLQNTANPPENALLLQGLIMLQDLNLVDKWLQYANSAYFVFAEQDAVVPCQIVQKVPDFSAKAAHIKMLPELSHAFPVTHPALVAEQICQFLTEASFA